MDTNLKFMSENVNVLTISRAYIAVAACAFTNLTSYKGQGDTFSKIFVLI